MKPNRDMNENIRFAESDYQDLIRAAAMRADINEVKRLQKIRNRDTGLIADCPTCNETTNVNIVSELNHGEIKGEYSKVSVNHLECSQCGRRLKSIRDAPYIVGSIIQPPASEDLSNIRTKKQKEKDNHIGNEAKALLEKSHDK